MSIKSRLDRLQDQFRATHEDPEFARLLIPCTDGDGNPPGSVVVVTSKGRTRIVTPEERRNYPELWDSDEDFDRFAEEWLSGDERDPELDAWAAKRTRLMQARQARKGRLNQAGEGE